MKAREAAFLLVFGVLAIVLRSPSVSASPDLESDYLNRVLTLRHF